MLAEKRKFSNWVNFFQTLAVLLWRPNIYFPDMIDAPPGGGTHYAIQENEP